MIGAPAGCAGQGDGREGTAWNVSGMVLAQREGSNRTEMDTIGHFYKFYPHWTFHFRWYPST